MSPADLLSQVSSYLRAAAFIVCAHLGLRLPLQTESTTLEIGGRSLGADVYRPSPALARQGTIVVVHGMTAHAQRDERIVGLCERLTLAGCVVVAPGYPEIAAFSTDAGIVDLLEQSLLAILADSSLVQPEGRLAVFSASFSALYVLMAACRPSLDGRTSSLCLIGGAYSAEAFATCLRQQDDNHFPRQVLLLNYLEHALGPHPHTVRALRAALEDNSFGRACPEFPQVFDELPEDERELYLRLREDQPFRKSVADRFIHKVEEIFDAHLVRFDALESSVVLLHGAEDEVLPASESARIYARLRQAKVGAWLEITPLIAHTTALRLTPALLPAVARLTSAFARFFRDAASPR